MSPLPDHARLYVGHGLFALCDWADWESLCGFWWHRRGYGRTFYAQTWDCHDTKTRKQLSMHRLVMGAAAEEIVDHINGNGLDNRRENLRIVTSQQNAMNQAGHGGSSRFCGVSWRAAGRTWRAYLTLNGKRRCLGDYSDEIDAARAYDTAAKEYFGEYARLNLP